MNQIKLWQR